MRSNGHFGMLSAGHCSGNGLNVYQPDSNGLVMGKVTWRIYGGSNIDALFIDTPGLSSKYVYTAATTVHPVDTYDARPGFGLSICTDGYASGQNCNVKLQWTGGCVTYNDGQTVCGLAYATSTNGGWIVRKGDSGGPVYRYSNADTGLIAEGVISGKTGPDSQTGSTGVYFIPFGLDLNSTFKLLCDYTCS